MPYFTALPCSCAFGELGACYHLCLETLRLIVFRFCGKAGAPGEKKRVAGSGKYLPPSTMVTIFLLGPPTVARNDEVQLPRRNDCVDCRAFRRFRSVAIQFGERRGVQKRPTGACGLCVNRSVQRHHPFYCSCS